MIIMVFMRIAFVGKGGAGKTTLTTLFADFISKISKKNIALFDADMNIPVGDLLEFENMDTIPHLSSGEVQKDIKNYIKGSNDRVTEISHLKKTTPPSEDSGYLDKKEFPSIKNGELLLIDGDEEFTNSQSFEISIDDFIEQAYGDTRENFENQDIENINLKKGVVVLDIRSREMYEHFHVPCVTYIDPKKREYQKI